ncbi:MAG TPA: NAD(P)-dependent alcohol dehydrogenase [Actinomycetota bacterium]|nr:NAD(P)-dependent alcohol dehydrogenase [Actinomycetota bacterium]
MKALVQDGYGGPEVLRIVDLPIPQLGREDVLVRVHAASLNEWDNGLMRGAPLINRIGGPRRARHRVLGSDIAGVVEAVGPAVTGFQPGDEVFGDLSASGFGAFAEYARAPESALTRKSASLSFQQAAAVPQAGGLAVAGLRKAGPLTAGQRLLMNGGGGGVGTFAIQIAKANGAQVTGVDGPGKLEAMRRVGADDVVDFTREDFTRSGQRYDLILDVVGRRSLGDYRRALRPGGVCGVIGGSTGRLVTAAVLGQTLRLSAGRRVSLVVYRANKADDVALLVRLIDEGAVVPVIDRVFPLSEGPQAMRHYLGGGFAGKIVITM